MATTIIDRLRWFSYGKQNLQPQEVPTHEELIAFGAEYSDETIRDRESTKDFQLAEGRDVRVYWINSKECSRTTLAYVPDSHGWYVEDLGGMRWRPTNLDELCSLMQEMDHQYDRYGELL